MQIAVAGTCRGHDDCRPNERCEVATVFNAVIASIYLPAGAVACPVCNNSLACGEGLTCNPETEQLVPPPCPAYCIPGCKHVDCPEDTMCIEGVCATPALLCNSPDATFSCPEGMHCAPEEDAPDLREWAGLGANDDNVAAILAIGCVPTMCEHDGGPICGTGFRCDPTDPIADRAGCVAISCAELGECPDPDRVCRAPVVNSEVPDAHGCVPRNCTEGHVCTAINTACDPEHVTNYVQGCRLLEPTPSSPTEPDCREGHLCAADEMCEIEHAWSDEFGCRPALCSDGIPCAAPYICQPGAAAADSHGCMPPPESSPCQSDEDCRSRDYCVLNVCRSQPGQCR